MFESGKSNRSKDEVLRDEKERGTDVTEEIVEQEGLSIHVTRFRVHGVWVTRIPQVTRRPLCGWERLATL